MRIPLFVATAMLCTSLSAHADTVTVSGIFASPTVIEWPSGSVYSNPFPMFNPVLGTLTSYTLRVAGIGTSADALVPELVFKAPSTGDAIIDATASSLAAFTFSGSGSTSFSGDLQGVTGSGTAQFYLQDFSIGPSGSTVLNFTQSDLIYTYTPAPVAAAPEPSSVALLGTGMLGIVGTIKRRCA